MADDLANRGKQDRGRVNVNEPHELCYWTAALSCTEQPIRDAVKSVGVMGADVRASALCESFICSHSQLRVAVAVVGPSVELVQDYLAAQYLLAQ